MISYYKIEEVRKLFKVYKIIDKSNLTEKEYNLFCSWLQFLPKEIIDRILSEISFCLLSYENNDAACYIPLHTPDMNGKIGIIVVPQAVFAVAIEMPGQENVEKKFLHEIAHFICGHTEYVNAQKKDQIEREANDLADRWMREKSAMPTTYFD